VVIGDGPEYKKIARRATPNIKLLGFQDDQALATHLQQAKALVFAADEDFGILPVEAQACGTPVIAYGRGGARETILDGETGIFFAEQTADSIMDAVDRFESQPPACDPSAIREHALRFSTARFCRELTEFVRQAWAQFQQRRVDVGTTDDAEAVFAEI